jgi:hypothetical protein
VGPSSTGARGVPPPPPPSAGRRPPPVPSRPSPADMGPMSARPRGPAGPPPPPPSMGRMPPPPGASTRGPVSPARQPSGPSRGPVRK